MTLLRVSPKVVSQSAEKRFEKAGSSRSSNTDLRKQKVRLDKIMKNVLKIGKTRISLRATMGEDETDRI